MRMRPHVDRAREVAVKMRGAEMIEEDERADHLLLRKWQHTSHFESAEVMAALFDHQLYCHS
jgi:hypothetical protein